MMKSFLLALLISTSTQALTAPPDGSPVYETGSAENVSTFSSFKQALANRFAQNSQQKSFPSFKIASYDCDIEVIDVSRYGDGVHIAVKNSTKYPGYFTVYSGNPLTYSPGASWFSASTYTETCEEQGCDGRWYENNRLDITAATLEILSVEAYGAGVRNYVCHLK